MAGHKFRRGGAKERYLYVADWQRRRAEFMRTAAIVKACLGNADGASANLADYFKQLFPEYGESTERSAQKHEKFLKRLDDLPSIPLQPPPQVNTGLDRLPRTAKVEDLTPSWDPPKPQKKAWGAP